MEFPDAEDSKDFATALKLIHSHNLVGKGPRATKKSGQKNAKEHARRHSFGGPMGTFRL